jgi:NodT family efflux transporter outer membrane factor (OMF) lipoprotein
VAARSFLVIAGLGGLLAGCTVGPDYRAPETPVPPAFDAASAAAGTAAKTTAAPPIEVAKWWRALNDPELDSLIERAIKSSPDIEIALTRLQEARTQEAVVLGQALPSLEASGGGGKGTGSDISRSRVSPTLGSADNRTGPFRRLNSVVGFDAGWQLDVFGQYRRATEAAGYDREAATAARNAVLIAVVADVARAYVDLRGLQVQLKVLGRNIDTSRRTFDVVQTRFSRGLTNELDLALARRELATLQAQVAPFYAEIAAAQHAIAVLIGEYPEDLARELAQPGMIPALPGEIEPGLPLDLLRRRPDIKQAERQLAANTARVGVATAALFPHLAITGGVGVQSQGLGVSPAMSKFIWSAGPAAYWPLLDFGTLDALVEIADLQTHEQLVRYKGTILSAVQEVDDAIAGFRAQQQRLSSLGDALTASRRSVVLATERYDRGLTDFLNVLDAERQEYELEQQYAAAQQTAAEQFIVLYRGLGGGWEEYQSIPPIRQPQPAVLAAFRRLLGPQDPPHDPAK